MKTTDANHAAQNATTHIHALSMTRLGDGLVDPKLVLSWLLTSLGAGAFWIGLLVPVREAGALLPQLFTAAKLRHVVYRKWWWVWGSVVQGLMVLTIAITGLVLEGAIAGAIIVLALSVFAVARSVCSISYKDVLGKTVEKPIRGRVSGTAASIAATGVLLFGVALMFNLFGQSVIVFGALFLASVLWLSAALRFSLLVEQPSEIAIDTTMPVWKLYLKYLREDRELQKFLVVRGLLTAVAVAPPFMLLLAASQTSSVLEQLGGLVVASSFAAFVSGRVWGSLSDRSTTQVLGYAGVAGAGFLTLAVIGVGYGWYELFWFLPTVLFGVMVAYQGVRIARNVHLVNLATEETRAAYAAVSNTIIGIVLLGTGLLGVLATYADVTAVLWLLVGMSIVGGLTGFTLKNP